MALADNIWVRSLEVVWLGNVCIDLRQRERATRGLLWLEFVMASAVGVSSQFIEYLGSISSSNISDANSGRCSS